MNNEHIEQQTTKIAAKIVSESRKAAVVYTVPFSNYGGQLVGNKNTRKKVEQAITDYDVNSEIEDIIMRAIQKNAQGIDDGETVVTEFRLPLSISKNRNGDVEIKFQT